MVEEEWRPVPDFPNYEISNRCRVRNAKGKILRPIYDQHGRYVRYCFRYNGKQLTKNAHRVMWRAFHGEIPAGLQLNHKDGNRRNNDIENLEVVTQSENTKHAYRMGFIGSGDSHHSRRRPDRMARGERHGGAKLSEDQARQIIALKRSGVSCKQIAREFGVTSTTASDVGNKTWRHVTLPPLQSSAPDSSRD